ncbi:uncharacterized protein LOC125010064 isoform X2 [Mugil cephalus]|uniref:uncharacterized protein LOC125010064 isoform X2 n=1 Tax=Mugil cephalus TaxID=48193 RepID=UPI001FB76065|nr:uncharacterized protein LOC125010064 isoform X2 [Mugil cephalus]
MELFPVLPLLWLSSLALLGPHDGAEGNSYDMCEIEIDSEELHIKNSTGYDDSVDESENLFICLLYPSKNLSCSWSSLTTEKNAHLSVSVSVCSNSEIQSMEYSSMETVGSMSWTLNNTDFQEVIFLCNISHNDKWTSYTFSKEKGMIEVLSPPTNVSASVKDGDLYVTWVLMNRTEILNEDCYESELYIDDQERPQIIIGKPFYKKPNADPTHTYLLKIRTRLSQNCFGCFHWSDWSSTVTVEPSAYKYNPLVIVLICLGVPMILLAVLLLIRYQRVTKVLFPEIPRPPEKYKNFLEKYDTLTFFHPVLTAKPEEEITEVEDVYIFKNVSIQEIPEMMDLKRM